jgi:crotonobetainyl-CoA:carnitine CoA-transferase CaiB-like acyl-CoA transferase
VTSGPAPGPRTSGDDTRGWGPPFVTDAQGERTSLSAYFLSANRNKRAIAMDLAHPDGAALVRRLAQRADVLVENFKVGDLARHGLDYASVAREAPPLVYCSITGFGQTGPRASEVGYDFLAQAMGGVMSLTGPREGAPTKVGVGVADVVCGLYATIGILAALGEARRSGLGQHVDVALYDTLLSWLVNAATSTLPARHGNAHPTIVPYESFDTADGALALAVGNDGQFAKLVAILERPELTSDPRFATNAARVGHREVLVPTLAERFRTGSTARWIEALVPAGVPAGPVRTVDEAFADPQTVARGMRVELASAIAGSGARSLVGSPLHLSRTPVTYRHAPPDVGQDGVAVLQDWLDMDGEAIGALTHRRALSVPAMTEMHDPGRPR